MVADSCHFDGGQTGILAEGPVDVVLRDCTMGPGQPSIWFDNARSNVPVFGELRLMHTSIMAGSAPVFRFDGTQVRVWVDDSVIARRPAGRSPATLVMVDNSRNLTWRGRSNLYSGIGVYLAHAGRDDRVEPITDFARWSETPTELRETGTHGEAALGLGRGRPRAGSAGRDRQPHASLSPEFRPSHPLRHRGSSGAIWVGPQERADCKAFATGRVTRRARRSKPAPSRPLAKMSEPAESKELKVAATEPMPVNPSQSGRPRGDIRSRQSAADAAHVHGRGRRPVDHRRRQQPSAAAATGATTEQPAPGEPVAATREPADAARSNRERRPGTRRRRRDPKRGPVHVRCSIGSAGKGALCGSPPGPISIFQRFPSMARAGISSWLSPDPGGRASGSARSKTCVAPSADWTVMSSLRSGSLHLQGIDVVVPDQEMLQTDRLAIAGLMPGTELTVTDCTLTLAANRPGAAALFVVQPLSAARNTQSADGASGPSAVIRVRDSLLRSGGEGAAVATGRKVDIQLTNVLVSTEGSLVHAVGEVRSGRADSPSVKVRLDQVTALGQRGTGAPRRHQESRRTGTPLRRHRGRQLDPEHG